MEKARSKARMNKRQSIIVFAIIASIACVLCAYAQSVYEKDGNLYIKGISGKETRLTSQGKDYEPKLSPDGKQIVFVRLMKDCPYTSDTGWFPSDYDAIWSMDAEGNNQRCIVKNNYSEKQDMDYYLGDFNSMCFSSDGKFIYYLCQNSASNAILYKAKSDGTNIKRLSHAHGIGGVVGGSPEDEYYGYIMVHMKKYSENQPNRWVTVLMDSEGREIKEIDDIDRFWSEHRTN